MKIWTYAIYKLEMIVALVSLINIIRSLYNFSTIMYQNIIKLIN